MRQLGGDDREVGRVFFLKGAGRRENSRFSSYLKQAPQQTQGGSGRPLSTNACGGEGEGYAELTKKGEELEETELV